MEVLNIYIMQNKVEEGPTGQRLPPPLGPSGWASGSAASPVEGPPAGTEAKVLTTFLATTSVRALASTSSPRTMPSAASSTAKSGMRDHRLPSASCTASKASD